MRDKVGEISELSGVSGYLMAGLGPSRVGRRLLPGPADGVRSEVPGRAAVAMVSSLKMDSAIPSSNISKKSTRTCSVSARVLRLQAAWRDIREHFFKIILVIIPNAGFT